jgi:hypothetical protein
MILTHFGINNQTFTNGGAQELQVQVDTVLVKSQAYSFTMHGMSTQ